MAEEYIISVVIEGSDKASKPLKDAKENVTGLNTNLINTMVALEGVASGMNQLVGGMNKMVGGLEKTEGKFLGMKVASEENVKALRNVSTTMEIMIGPMEMGIALMKLHTVAMSSATVAELGFAGAVGVATSATWAWTVALLANPIVLIVVGIITLVGVLYLLEKKFGVVTAAVDALTHPLEYLQNLINGLIYAFDDLGSKADTFSNVLKFTPIGMAMELGGALR